MPTFRISSATSRSASGVAFLRLEAEVAERDGHRVDVAADQRGEETDDARAEALGELLGEAEVEEHDARALGLDEQVAGVRIGVEEAVGEDLLGEDVDERVRHPRRVDAGLPQRAHVVDLDALDELHHEHAAARVLPDDRRDVDLGAVREAAADRLGVAALVLEVELARHLARRARP